jgi:hypothetical protein
LERHLESKSWSSRGSFMSPLSNSFVMCVLEESERGTRVGFCQGNNVW